MSELFNPSLNQLINQFDQPGSAAQTRLIALLEQAHLLRAELEKAVASGGVTQLSTLEEYNTGGSYDPNSGELQLAAEYLSATSPRNHNRALFQLGHETGHGNYVQEFKDALNVMWQQAESVRNAGAGEIHDYSDALAMYRQAHRVFEAKAHISGFNALVDYMRELDPQLNLNKLFDAIPYGKYVEDFLENKGTGEKPNYQFKAGIVYNSSDFSISLDNPQNIEIMGQYYFDKPSTQARIGKAQSDYTNFYATKALGEICQREREHPEQAGKIMLDMQRLGLDPALIEANGFDAGDPGQRCEYYDTRDPNTPRYLNHTAPSGNKPEQEQSFSERYEQQFGYPYQPTGYTQYDEGFQAFMSGDDARLDRILEDFHQSPAYKALEAKAEALLVQQKEPAIEPTPQQEQQIQQQTAMVMKRDFH